MIKDENCNSDTIINIKDNNNNKPDSNCHMEKKKLIAIVIKILSQI